MKCCLDPPSDNATTKQPPNMTVTTTPTTTTVAKTKPTTELTTKLSNKVTNTNYFHLQ